MDLGQQVCHQQHQLHKEERKSCLLHQQLAHKIMTRALAKEIEEGATTDVVMTGAGERMVVAETIAEAETRAAATTIATEIETVEMTVRATGTEVLRQVIHHSHRRTAMALCHHLVTHRCQALCQATVHCRLAIHQAHRLLASQHLPACHQACLRQAIGQAHHQVPHHLDGEPRKFQVGQCHSLYQVSPGGLQPLAALRREVVRLQLQQANHQQELLLFSQLLVNRRPLLAGQLHLHSGRR
mmetsp:Transcript_24251/g.53344  ORF Transcript_24251/g.53344 Transcript_24251/m.53344 type:complete len:241 (+) Transcript_24251:349-1071(+)